MFQLLATTQTAVVVRHWFEIDLEDASMEHGCRVELRQLVPVEHRGSESASQLISADRPLWRADIFDRLDGEPGTFSAAHFHPFFNGNEPCDRVWDEGLTRDPWRWLGDQVRGFGTGSPSQPAPLDPDDAAELQAMADHVVSIGQQFSPEVCTSTEQCYRSTRDARGAVSLMVRYLKKPTSFDHETVSLWTEGQGG